VGAHVRDAEEAQRALLTLVALPARGEGTSGNSGLASRLATSLPLWTPYLEQLVAQRRVGIARIGEAAYWVSAERLAAFTQVFPAARFASAMPRLAVAEIGREEALLACVTGWMTH